VGICLLLCGFVGYHVCVTRTRRRRRLLLQDVEFKVDAGAGAKQYVPAFPPLQWGEEGAEDTGRRTGEGKRFSKSHAVRVLGLFPRLLSWGTCYIATLGSLRLRISTERAGCSGANDDLVGAGEGGGGGGGARNGGDGTWGNGGGGKGGGEVGGDEGGVGDRHGAISSVDAGKIHTREQQRLVRSEEVEIEIMV
jgi:hypothetical protein